MIAMGYTIVARRRFLAEREKVFAAFGEPSQLSQWFSPSEDIATEVGSFEFRANGAYRIGFRFPDGEVRFVNGRFREVSRPTRIVFTWIWEEPDPHAGIETLVTVDLVDSGSGTEVVVTHERFPDLETRDRHDEGWATTLLRLEHLLEMLGH